MNLPPEIVAFVTGVVAFAVTQGIKVALNTFGVDLSGYAAAITALLVNIALAFGAGLLAKVPTDLQGFVLQALVLLIGILTTFGSHRVYTALKPK